MSTTDGATRECPSSYPSLSFGLRDAGTLFGLLAIVAVFAALTPNFLTERNLLNILQQSSINACVALGMTLVIICRRHRSVGRADRGTFGGRRAAMMMAGVPSRSPSSPALVSASAAGASTACSSPTAACSPSSSRWARCRSTGRWRSSTPAATHSSGSRRSSGRSSTHICSAFPMPW